ncbi:V-type H+-transporting ATPase subunit a [Fistulifera solaris]|uniref:V-type proton ATPase subunit a n=1 Tax=Fistulifera solaris TaxID=1519565 RepID=A0A1Z5K1S7_FISSO|nr:V-type H+-transporting ATPase subunit a [Fistulifera solaris]|eukprot:GAX19971.1 V-type H+-transporting ATPase subunit a [Fistulifera solaris]
MARWFRSEPMEYISLIVNEDAAHDCLADLGRMGVIQFTDLNPDLTPFQRRYVSYVKRCDELERKLRFFVSETDKFELELVSPGTVEEFVGTAMHTTGNGSKKTSAQLLEGLENEIGKYEAQLRELNSYSEKLTTEYNEKVELQEVLEKARFFFMVDSHRFANSSAIGGHSHTSSLLEGDTRTDLDMRFSSITGVVSAEEKARFERMIFRATRGNCYVRFANIDQPIADPETGLLVEKVVFIIFYKSESIETKLKKICDAFSAHRYSLPDMDDSVALDNMMTENAQELADSRTVLLKNQDMRYRLCQMLARHTERWTWIVLREKAVYHSLNMFKSDVSGMLRGEGWVIAESYDAVREAVEVAHSNMDMAMPSLVDHVPQPWPTPPTHFITNKFTYAYQEFVNTYGIPRYREANPALFTAATFPFLFGVMYGDIGHGLFLFCAGLTLLWNEKANENAKLGEMGDGMHTGRYMITMMGFFAVYAGFIYNDMFSLGLNLFGSRWTFGELNGGVEASTVAEMTARYGTDESVYPFGLDPAWHVSSNELLFFNSFKMKLSVIFGIIQMFAGTLLKGANAIYFQQRLDLLYEFIPMVVFASSLFLYMVFLIFYKWSTDWNSRMLSATCIDPTSAGWNSPDYDGKWVTCQSETGLCTPWGYACTGKDDTAALCPLNYGGSGDGCQPPNLITTLINIALNPGTVDEPMYAGQGVIQNLLLLCAFGSVPVLLLAKPYFMSQQTHMPIVHHSEDYDQHEEEHGEEHNFGEIIIHQAIETIEFVLGMVSNTASYLRLWALSLAHSELATVFWEKAMLSTLNMNWFAAFIGYGIFAGVTFGVLLMMDVLECFLHALRLHWVEFQNKFFKADGIRFAPYSFKQIIKDSTT